MLKSTSSRPHATAGARFLLRLRPLQSQAGALAVKERALATTTVVQARGMSNHNHSHDHKHDHAHHDHSFVLLYEYPKDMAVRRDPYRAAHLALAQKLKDDGKLVSAGPFSDATGAAFVFKARKRQEVEEFVRADPYYKHGLVTHYSIKEWHPLF